MEVPKDSIKIYRYFFYGRYFLDRGVFHDKCVIYKLLMHVGVVRVVNIKTFEVLIGFHVINGSTKALLHENKEEIKKEGNISLFH